jgi:2-oxo-4-hydroxy-4-carboxy--5-ureidoimidazoline (OHCU) decarboxylase
VVSVTAALPSLEELNDLDALEAATALGPLFERAPGFLHRLVAARPFVSWDALFESARTIAHELPASEQVELVDAHPRLGAAPGTVSAHSHREQGYDRAPGPADDATGAELQRLNDAYEARYGFRYCVFVAGRPREVLLRELDATMGDSPDRSAELRRALDAVVDIARARAGFHG